MPRTLFSATTTRPAIPNHRLTILPSPERSKKPPRCSMWSWPTISSSPTKPMFHWPMKGCSNPSCKKRRKQPVCWFFFFSGPFTFFSFTPEMVISKFQPAPLSRPGPSVYSHFFIVPPKKYDLQPCQFSSRTLGSCLFPFGGNVFCWGRTHSRN